MKHNTTPKGSFLDSNGKRWTNVLFDVMKDNGSTFVQQIRVRLELHFDFAIGGYVLDDDLGQPLTDTILSQYPLLRTMRNLSFVITQNKVLNK